MKHETFDVGSTFMEEVMAAEQRDFLKRVDPLRRMPPEEIQKLFWYERGIDLDNEHNGMETID